MRPAILIALVVLAGCGPTPGEEAMAEMEVSLRAEADMVRRGAGLHEIFHQECTDDCSGHRAGYLWALDNPDVTQDDCEATISESFGAGCERGLIAASFAD